MDQVGRYQILEELGRGAMGLVYKALDPAIGRTVAIKTIRLADVPDAGERRRLRDRVLREAQAAGVLSHPNIVTIYDVLENDEFAYIFMEYVNGPSLEHLLTKKALPDGTTLLKFLRQVADALDYAHRKGIVHRDIKPANILISESGHGGEQLAKIADFGVAKVVSHEVTQSGGVIGTPNYMSPEQIEGRAVNGRSDQFAFGVVIYELLTGTKPFTGDTLPALLNAICHQEPKPVEEVNPSLSETVGKVLQRVLAKSPEQRFALCGDFIGALSIALGDSPGWTIGTDRAATAAPKPSEEGPFLFQAEKPATGVVTRIREKPKEAPPPPVTGQPHGSSFGKKLGLISAMCLAIAIALALIVHWNSGPAIPTQTIDTNSGSAAPPPDDAEPATSARTGKQKQLARATSASAPSREASNRIPSTEPAPSAEGPPIADVELLSEPPGAKLLVDGNSGTSCTTPCTLSLPAGRHTLTAQMDGYNEAKRIFNVPQARSLLISMNKSIGVLLITSTPPGATVYVDGKISGQTPATLHLTAGTHHLLLQEGGRRHEETVVVESDGFEARSFRWD